MYRSFFIIAVIRHKNSPDRLGCEVRQGVDVRLTFIKCGTLIKIIYDLYFLATNMFLTATRSLSVTEPSAFTSASS